MIFLVAIFSALTGAVGVSVWWTQKVIKIVRTKPLEALREVFGNVESLRGMTVRFTETGRVERVAEPRELGVLDERQACPGLCPAPPVPPPGSFDRLTVHLPSSLDAVFFFPLGMTDEDRRVACAELRSLATVLEDLPS